MTKQKPTYPIVFDGIDSTALAAITAAKSWTSWGPFAAAKFAAKRGVPIQLLRTARACHDAERLGIPH